MVLVGVEGEENIGYVARAMNNFCVDDLVLVNPVAKVTDISVQRSMRGATVLKKMKTFSSIKKAVAGSDLVVGTTGKIATEKNLLRAAASPKDFAKNIGNFNGSVSILFGRESSGLKNEELLQCDLVVTIPTDKENPALNIANAVAIVLYELFNRSPLQRRQPSKKEKEVLYKFFSRLLVSSSCSEKRKKTTVKVFGNMVERSLLSRNELYTLAGALRKMLEKLKKN
ncbi:MAG: TrmJ/YjtD family RNA methyltransferase [Candidatus Aenigmatarchaeota archaeon]